MVKTPEQIVKTSNSSRETQPEKFVGVAAAATQTAADGGAPNRIISTKDSSHVTAAAFLEPLLGLLDKATRAVPRVAFATGVVGIGAAAAIISKILGQDRLAFLSVAAIFSAMILLYIFSRIEKSRDLVIRLAGLLIVAVTALAFSAFVLSSMWAVIECRPLSLVYMYGIDARACEMLKPLPAPPSPQPISFGAWWRSSSAKP